MIAQVIVGIRIRCRCHRERVVCRIPVGQVQVLRLCGDRRGDRGCKLVGERGRRGLTLQDFTGVAGFGRREAVDGFLRYRITDARRQRCSIFCFSVFQCERCHTVCEGHVAISAVDVTGIQSHSEIEGPLLIDGVVGYHRLADFEIAAGIEVRDDQTVLSVVLHCGRQRVCRILCFRDRDDHLMSTRVIGHARHVAIHFGDRVLILPGSVIRDFAEDRRVGICFCCRRCGVRRHRRTLRHCVQIEGKAVCFSPVVELLCHLKRRLRGRKSVRDRQAVRSVVLHSCRQRVCIVVFRDRDDHLMSTRVIVHAVSAIVHLSDLILVGPRSVICDLPEGRRGCVFCRRRCRRRVIRRHRCVFRHCRQIEGEALRRLAPVVEGFCHLQIDCWALPEVSDESTFGSEGEGVGRANRIPVHVLNHSVILRPVLEIAAAVGRRRCGDVRVRPRLSRPRDGGRTRNGTDRDRTARRGVGGDLDTQLTMDRQVATGPIGPFWYVAPLRFRTMIPDITLAAIERIVPDGRHA